MYVKWSTQTVPLCLGVQFFFSPRHKGTVNSFFKITVCHVNTVEMLLPGMYLCPCYKPELSSRFQREGKSGQRRATHRLSAGFPLQCGKEKVPQKITTSRQLGEKVKM